MDQFKMGMVSRMQTALMVLMRILMYVAGEKMIIHTVHIAIHIVVQQLNV